MTQMTTEPKVSNIKGPYPLGEAPPLGVVPQRMYAATLRRERFGQPKDAFALEVVDVPRMGPRQVLVYVMAAGINFNNVWAALGKPIDVISARARRGSQEDFHIGGSDGAGIVWAVGADVSSVKVGDPVVLFPGRFDEHAADIRAGVDQPASSSASAWGYEDNFGSFAQFALVDDYQCLPKPPRLTWEEAGCYLLCAMTAYRQLTHWAPNTVKPGDPVLVWGAAGGLGSMALQLIKHLGGLGIAVVSDQERAEYCRKLGATGTIDRTKFDHWQHTPDPHDWRGKDTFTLGARAFLEAFFEALGERRRPKLVFEHSGQSTVPTSMWVCENGGMVVLCGGTSGFNAQIDLRYLWMRQKRLQGSHGANLRECGELNHLINNGTLNPCLSDVRPLADVGLLHQLLLENRHPTGNMAVLVGAPRRGLKSLQG